MGPSIIGFLFKTAVAVVFVVFIAREFSALRRDYLARRAKKNSEH